MSEGCKADGSNMSELLRPILARHELSLKRLASNSVLEPVVGRGGGREGALASGFLEAHLVPRYLA